MPRIEYVERNFAEASLALIGHANAIIAEYARQGFTLTLRQLYYQFVSRDLIPNTMRSYKNLGSVVNDGRRAGLIDWNAIVDRTRELASIGHWDTPASIIGSCAAQFRFDKWAKQATRVEVWIEKDALVGVIDDVCTELDVPYLSCRGSTSQSEMPRCRSFSSKPYSITMAVYSISGTAPISRASTRGWALSIRDHIFSPIRGALANVIRPSVRTMSMPGNVSSSGWSSNNGRKTLVPRLRPRA